MLLIDYRCEICTATFERSVARPIPSHLTCPVCGGSMQRRYSSLAVLRGHRSRPPANDREHAHEHDGGGTQPVAPCTANPDVPGLCHIHDPQAAQAWVAEARGMEQPTPR